MIHEFYELYRVGHDFKAWSQHQKQEWDKNVQKTLIQYLNTSAVNMYLINTGRGSISEKVTELLDEEFPKALKEIKSLLDTGWRHYFK